MLQKKSSDATIVEWTGNATSAFTINNDKQIRWTSIDVTYTTSTELYTVTLADDNTKLTQKYGGEPVSLPSRSAIGDYTFAGWSETNVAEETTTTPAIVDAGDYGATANVTLYPIYTRFDGLPNKTVSVNVAEYANSKNWTVLASGSATKETHCKYEIDINDDVTVTTNDDNVNGAVYSDGWRIYQSYKGAISVSTTTGSLVSVKFTYGNANSGQLFYGEEQLTSKTAIDVEGTSANFNVIRTGSTNTNGQVKITDIEVTYRGGVTYYVSSPTASTTATITLNAACTDGEFVYGTYSNSSAWEVPANLTVSEVGVVGGALVVGQYATGAIVPANTGVMVSATKGGEYNVILSNEAGTSVLGDDNCLRPSGDAGITATNMAEADTEFFRLTMHNGETIGFFWGAEEGAAFDLGQNKAYLAVSTDNLGLNTGSAKRLWISNETVGIKNVPTNVENNVIYNLNGQRVSSAAKGLYIKNGKKYLVK